MGATNEKRHPEGCLSCPQPLLLSGWGGCDFALWQLFFDTSRLARTLTQVVQLGATHVTAAFHFDRSDQRRIQLERTLNTFTRRDLTNDEVRVQAAVTTRNDDAFVCLGALAVAFDDVDADDDGVARCEIRNGAAEARDFFLFELLNQIHFYDSKNHLAGAYDDNCVAQ